MNRLRVGPTGRWNLRADARKNRLRLLCSAVELILEAGGEPAREAVAERADLGIGTLYRHFPDRQSLLRAVVLHALETTIKAGEAFLQDVPDATDALRRYMHAALDNGIGVVNMIHPLLENAHWPDLRTRAEALLNLLVKRAVREGKFRDDLSESDIVFALIRFGRPLAVGIPQSEERALAHRHLDFYIDGLCAKPRD
jgi:AcrR family transcriptional regulator